MSHSPWTDSFSTAFRASSVMCLALWCLCCCQFWCYSRWFSLPVLSPLWSLVCFYVFLRTSYLLPIPIQSIRLVAKNTFHASNLIGSYIKTNNISTIYVLSCTFLHYLALSCAPWLATLTISTLFYLTLPQSTSLLSICFCVVVLYITFCFTSAVLRSLLSSFSYWVLERCYVRCNVFFVWCWNICSANCICCWDFIYFSGEYY